MHRVDRQNGDAGSGYWLWPSTDIVKAVPMDSVFWLVMTETQLTEAIRSHRHADQAATKARHEVDSLRRNQLLPPSSVAFILPILVIQYL